MTATTTAAQLVLQDSRSKLFYNEDLGGFSETDKSKATRLDVATSQAAFIKAHFQRPEVIVEVPLTVAPPFTAQDLPKLAEALAAAPSPANAHLNPHLNGTLRPVKSYHGRGMRTYRFGDWRIEITTRTESRKQGCGFRKTSTVTNFDLCNTKTGQTAPFGSGGLKAAVDCIMKTEMKRHHFTPNR